MKQSTIMAVEEISYLYSKGMHPSGLAERLGLARQPIEWPLAVHGTQARTHKNGGDTDGE